MSVGGATQVPRKVEHEYDRLVKVVKQTEGGQSKREERNSLERSHKYCTSEKQERDTMLQYHIQDYLTPIRQESNKRFQNRPNKALLQGELTCIFKTKCYNDHMQCIHIYIYQGYRYLCGSAFCLIGIGVPDTALGVVSPRISRILNSYILCCRWRWISGSGNGYTVSKETGRY